MPEDKAKPNCFMIMPITTPPNVIKNYLSDAKHFEHVRECLFEPAINQAGFHPIPPISSGSSIIQADIIKNLNEADLVLCDMSIFNSNVFFEFGIRTALNKPVAVVKDEKITDFPFDTSPIQCHTYDSSLSPWLLRDEIDKLFNHIRETFSKSSDYNPMWRIFSGSRSATLKPEEISIKEQIDFVLGKLSNIENRLNQGAANMPVSGFSGYSSVGDVFPNKISPMTELYAKWYLDQMSDNSENWKDKLDQLYRLAAEASVKGTPLKDPEEKK